MVPVIFQRCSVMFQYSTKNASGDEETTVFNQHAE